MLNFVRCAELDGNVFEYIIHLRSVKTAAKAFASMPGNRATHHTHSMLVIIKTCAQPDDMRRKCGSQQS